MDKFLVRRHDSYEDAGKASVRHWPRSNMGSGARARSSCAPHLLQSHSSGCRTDCRGGTFVRRGGSSRKRRARTLHCCIPFRFRMVVADGDTAAAPGCRREAGRLDNQPPVGLAQALELIPICYRSLGNVQSGHDGLRRQRARVQYPGFRYYSLQGRYVLCPQLLLPEFSQARDDGRGQRGASPRDTPSPAASW